MRIDIGKQYGNQKNSVRSNLSKGERGRNKNTEKEWITN